MNPRIWLSALAIRLIKRVTLAAGLLTSVQSVWAVCDAELLEYKRSDTIFKRATMDKYNDDRHTAILKGDTSQIPMIHDRGDGIPALIGGINSNFNELNSVGKSKFAQEVVKDLEGLFSQGLPTRVDPKWAPMQAQMLRDKYSSTANYSLCMWKWFASGSTASSAQSQQSQQPHQSAQQVQQSQASQQSQQAQQLAQQNQARADQQRQGKRKTNDPVVEVSNCLGLDKDAALYGGFKNTCEYKVNYVFCNYGPKKDSWADFHNCEKKNGIGAWQVGGGRASAAHTKNTAMVYWFACKDPATPVDSEFMLGKGIEARCHN